MKRLWLIFACVLIACLCACSPLVGDNVEFDGGVVLTPEILQSIKDDIGGDDSTVTPDSPESSEAQSGPNDITTDPAPNTTESIPETTESVPDTTDPVIDTTEAATETTELVPDTTEPVVPDTTEPVPDEITVYWTESGTKYHTHRDCGSLKNSVNVKEGTLEEAIEAGKESICLKCDKKDKAEKTEE